MQQEQVLFSLPLNRLEPIFKKWVKDVLDDTAVSSPAGEHIHSAPMSVGQAAEFLGVSQQTVYNNIRRIPHAKRLGRLYFLRSELENYLSSGKVRQL